MGNRTLTCISTDSPATTVTWMKDGKLLTIDDSSHYTLSQTITDRVSSTYSNVLTVSESAPGVAGRYICNVSNDLGSDSMEVVAVGEYVAKNNSSFAIRQTVAISGISIEGLDYPLEAGKSATINCTTNEVASKIEWMNQTTVLATTMDVNVTALDYTIPLVTDSLQGKLFTCTAIVINTSHTETVTLGVKGSHNTVYYTVGIISFSLQFHLIHWKWRKKYQSQTQWRLVVLVLL